MPNRVYPWSTPEVTTCNGGAVTDEDGSILTKYSYQCYGMLETDGIH